MLEAFDIVSSAVADPSRVRILKLLERDELCVCQITVVLDLAPATISKHLALLKSSGLVQQRREGKWIYYRLAEHELNAYARPFLDLLKSALHDDATLAKDNRLLDQVLSTPIQVICDEGRSALDIVACCAPGKRKRAPARATSQAPSPKTIASVRRPSRRSP